MKIIFDQLVLDILKVEVIQHSMQLHLSDGQTIWTAFNPNKMDSADGCWLLNDKKYKTFIIE